MKTITGNEFGENKEMKAGDIVRISGKIYRLRDVPVMSGYLMQELVDLGFVEPEGHEVQKTIMDAVNELKGDIQNCFFFESSLECDRGLLLNSCSKFKNLWVKFGDKIAFGINGRNVCSLSEFDKLLLELESFNKKETT